MILKEYWAWLRILYRQVNLRLHHQANLCSHHYLFLTSHSFFHQHHLKRHFLHHQINQNLRTKLLIDMSQTLILSETCHKKDYVYVKRLAKTSYFQRILFTVFIVRTFIIQDAWRRQKILKIVAFVIWGWWFRIEWFVRNYLLVWWRKERRNMIYIFTWAKRWWTFWSLRKTFRIVFR